MKTIWTLALGALFALNIGAAEINTEKSAIIWEGEKVSGKHHGALSFKSGEAIIKDGHLKGGTFTVAMNSLDVTDLEGDWKKKFLGHMKSPDFFNVKNHPTSRLIVTSIKGNAGKGELTIKGKTHPVTFSYVKEENIFSGSFTFDRTKFGMIYNSGNFFKDLGDKLIKDQVKVDYRIVLK